MAGGFGRPGIILGVLAVTVAAGGAAGQERALIDAARIGNIDRIALLLDRGAAIDERLADGSTALHFAAQQGLAAVAEVLIAAGADVDARTRYGVTPLALAVGNGDAAVVGLLLEAGADVNLPSRENQTPLMSAALNGRPAALALLLEHGAAVDAADAWRGQTALMWAAAEGNTEALRLLLDAGADVAAASHSGFTALLIAARNAHVDTLRMLLEHGANANDLMEDDTSALNVAVVNANYEAAALLLEHGADPNLPDARGSPLHTIAWLRKPGSTGDAGVGTLPPTAAQPTGNVSSLELAQRLLDAGADPNARIDWPEMRFDTIGGTTRNPPGLVLGRHLLSYNGATAFYVAAKNGDAPFMRLLADNGADPLMPTLYGITPLMVAAGLDTWEGETPGPFTGVSEAERLEAVKLAVELGNDINAVADFGDYVMTGDPEYTLLYYPHNIGELLDLGVGDPRWDESTPLHGAIISNQPSIARYLIDQGARLDARTATGWTPLMMSRGVFLTNTGRDFPVVEEMLVTAMQQQGIPID